MIQELNKRISELEHEELVFEMKKRGYNHNSSLDIKLASGKKYLE